MNHKIRCILGIQGLCQYALDKNDRLWYRFTDELNNDNAWRLVTR